MMDFEQWFELLKAIVKRTVDEDTAREDYNAGISPEDSAKEFLEEWKTK